MKKSKVPKSNKFSIDIDPLARKSSIVNDMIKDGKTHKIIPNKKKKQNKESCRGNQLEKE